MHLYNNNNNDVYCSVTVLNTVQVLYHLILLQFSVVGPFTEKSKAQ